MMADVNDSAENRDNHVVSTNSEATDSSSNEMQGNVSDEVKMQILQDIAQVVEFKAAHDRLRERMDTTRNDMVRLRSQVIESRREVDNTLEHLRRQVAPLLPPSRSNAHPPSAPPPTPAE